MSTELIEIKNTLPKKESRFEEIGKILVENNITEDSIKLLFDLPLDKPLPYEHPMFCFAIEAILFKLKRIVINGNQISLLNEKFLKGLDLINSDTPPETLEDMSTKLELSMLKVYEYINQDGAYKKWYSSTLAVNGLRAFERINKGAKEESFNNSLGKGGHKWKANELSMKYAKTDLLKDDKKDNTEPPKKSYTYINFGNLSDNKEQSIVNATVIDSEIAPYDIVKNR
jgi:hypothetical protein